MVEDGYNIPLIETSCRFNCEILLYVRHSYFKVFAADSKSNIYKISVLKIIDVINFSDIVLCEFFRNKFLTLIILVDENTSI